MSEKEKELKEGELEQAAGGLKARRTSETLRSGSEEPLKARQSDGGTDPDPGHIDP